MIDLKKLLEEYPELVKKHNADKLRGFLKDLNPGENARNNIIVALLRNGFVEQMQNLATPEIPVSYYCERMENDFGYSADMTGECVELWADALGISDRLSTVSIVAPGGIKITYESQDIAKPLVSTNDYRVELNTLLYDDKGVAYLEFWAGNGSGKSVEVYLHGLTLDGTADKEFIKLGSVDGGKGEYLYLPLGKPARAEDHYAAFSLVIDDKSITLPESGNVSATFNISGHRFGATVA